MSGMGKRLAMNQIAELVNIPASTDARAIISAFSEQFLNMAPALQESDVALFDVVFMDIIQGSAVDDRIMLAERFAAVPNAPTKLVMTLAYDDEIQVSGPILRMSPRITHEALLDIASIKGEAHQAAIAMRPCIPPDICDLLANRGTPMVLIVMVNNPGADFDIKTRKTIIQKSFGNPDLFLAVDKHSEFVKVLRAAYEQSSGVQLSRDADAEVAGFIGAGHIDRALAIIAMEARTRHRAVMHAYKNDTLESFVIIARAANLSWGTMVGLLLNQFGIRISAGQINESRRLFDDTTRREALHKTRILEQADATLRS